jgi:hypothetical protein
MGNGQWTTYQAFPIELDSKLTSMGAQRMHDIGKGDVDKGDWEQDFLSWSSELWDNLTNAADAKDLSAKFEKKRSLNKLATLISKDIVHVHDEVPDDWVCKCYHFQLMYGLDCVRDCNTSKDGYSCLQNYEE